MNELILTTDNYVKMCVAIAECDRHDDCKDIIDKSIAVAAYYKQIKDEESVLSFNRIRVRAWRRMAQLLCQSIDFTDCETQTACIKLMRELHGNDPTVAGLSDSRLRELILISELTEADFEFAINQSNINGTIVDVLRRTPDAQAERARRVAENRARQLQYEEEERRTRSVRAAREAELRKTEQVVERHNTELLYAAEAAMQEVGITLERKDRTQMMQVVFLIKKEVHAVMRQAAFDKRITMQEVLRRGLRLWLHANDYDYPDDEVEQRVVERAHVHQ